MADTGGPGETRTFVTAWFPDHDRATTALIWRYTTADAAERIRHEAVVMREGVEVARVKARRYLELMSELRRRFNRLPRQRA